MKRTVFLAALMMAAILPAQTLMTAGGEIVSLPDENARKVRLSVLVNSGTDGTVSIFYDPRYLRFNRITSDCQISSEHPGCLAVFVSPECKMKFDAYFEPVQRASDYTFDVFLITSNSDEVGSRPTLESMRRKVVVAGFPVEPADQQRVQVAVVASPNPFNTSTEISFNLNVEDRVTVGVYDVGGRLVKRLADGNFKSGKYTFRWDGTDNSGEEVPSGIYFVKIQTSGTSDVKRIQLVK